MKEYYKIAEVVIEADRPWLVDGQAMPYLWHPTKPDISVTVTPEDLVLERRKAMREDEIEGLPAREYTAGQLASTALLRKDT